METSEGGERGGGREGEGARASVPALSRPSSPARITSFEVFNCLMPSQGFCFLWKKFQGSEWDFLPVSSHPLQTPYNDLAPNSLAACTTSRDFLWSTLCPSLSSEAHGKELASECSSLLKGSPEFPDSHTSTSWSLTVFCLFFFIFRHFLFISLVASTMFLPSMLWHKWDCSCVQTLLGMAYSLGFLVSSWMA